LRERGCVERARAREEKKKRKRKEAKTERKRASKRERWGAGVEYHFQEFNEPYAPS